MAKISAFGDSVALRLQRQDGTKVVVTNRGRLLAQRSRGGNYHTVDPKWVQPGSFPLYHAAIRDYLIANRYPDAVEITAS